MTRFRLAFTLLFGMLLALCTTAYAQKITSTLTGTVVDSTNAVVSDAAITVTNQGDATGQTTCRLSRVGDGGMGTAEFVTTPRLEPHQTRTFEAKLLEFGSTPVDLQVECRTP